MSKTKRLAICGMLAAMYFALSFLTIQTGTYKITFTSLALIIAAFLLGLPDTCAVALVGEGLYQLLLYPLSVTTPLWLLPPILHAAALWLFARLLCGRTPPERKVILCYVVTVLASLVNSAANTGALYIDSHVFHYYAPATFLAEAGIRLLIGLATAAVVTTAAIPLLRILRKKVSA